MANPTISVSRPFLGRSWQVLGAIVAANAIFNLFVGERNKSAWLQPMVIGIFMAQPVFFATWGAIGPPPAIKRVTLTIAALIVVEMASIVRTYLDNAPENWLELMCITLALFFASFIILCIVRVFSHWTITNRFAEADVVRSQFSLKYAIGLTTVVSLLLGLGRMLAFADSSTSHFTLIDFVREAAAPIGLMLLSMLPVVAVPLLILSRPPSIRSIFLIVGVWSVMSFIAIGEVAILEQQPWAEAARDIFCFQIGAFIVGATASALLRLTGYRLLNRRTQVFES